MPIPKMFLIMLLAAATAVGACSTTNKGETKSELIQRAQSGDVDARYQLGEKYADATFPNTLEAIYWLCLAAKEGHVPAQMRLARLYEDQAAPEGSSASKGSLSNRGAAYFWYTAAASQGDDQAFSRRESLESTMDASEVAEIKRRATRWQQAGCLRPS